MNINEKIESLSEGEKREFSKYLMELLHDRHLCNRKGINYLRPDVMKAKEVIFNEMYPQS